MTRLAWGAHGERFFETGTDRGVLYLSGKAGVPWNGLKAVNESVTGGDAKPFYLDGYKYLNVSSYEEFSATIEAFSAPHEFGVCDGAVGIHNGLFATEQPRVEFGLSYRTLIGNDQDGIDHGYKIHLVYNALAAPSTRNRQSVGGGVNILGLSWSITTQPPLTTSIRPTAHFVIDSRRTPSGLLRTIEDILYGTNATEARLPTVDELRTLFTSNGPLLGRNLFTNPSFESSYGSGQVTVYENLFTNPSFETANGTVEVRRNLWTDPRGTSMSGYSLLASTATPVAVSSPASSTAIEITATGPGATAYKAAALPAGSYTLSADVWIDPSASAGANARVRVGGAGVTGGETATQVTTKGQWVRSSVTFTLASTHGALPQIQSSTSVSGDKIRFTNILIEASPVPGPYFDGGTSPDPDLTPSWAGSPNNSESVVTGVGVGGVNGSAYIGARGVKSGGSLRIIAGTPQSSNGNSAVSIPMSPILQAGKTYTFLTKIRLTAPLTGTNEMYSRRIRVLAGNFPVSPAVPNEAGVHELRWTVTLPADAGAGTVQLWHGGSAGSPDIWYDELLIVEGVYNGPYFDGSTPPKIRRNLIPNPSIKTWGAWTIPSSFTGYPGGIVDIAAGAGAGNLLPYLMAGVAAYPGEVFSAGMDVSVPVGYPALTLRLSLVPYNSSSVSIPPIAYGDTVTVNPGETKRIVVDGGVMPAAVNSVRVIPYLQEPPKAGRRIVFSNAILERAGVVGSFFSGSSGQLQGGYQTAWEGAVDNSPSYIYDPDFTTAWSGTPNASTSKVTGMSVPGGVPVRCIAIKSTRWVESGSYSMRLIPIDSTSNVSYYSVVLPAAVVASGTFITTFHQEDMLSGPLWAQRGRPYTVTPMNQPDQAAPNAGETTKMRFGWINVTNSTLVLPHGGTSGSGDVWYDCLGIFEGDYKGPWFDGNSVEDGHTFLWLGEPDQSVSEHYSWYF